MKHMQIRLLLIILVPVAFTCNALPQDAPVVGTEAAPVWYKIESACTNPVTLNGAYTGPADLTGYVLTDPGAANNRIHATNAQTGDESLWALVDDGSVVKLKNKGTGRYMTGSYGLNNTGEYVEWGTYGQDQYWIRSGGNSTIVIWNNLVCDRLNGGTINSNTAFYFMLQSDEKEILGALILAAEKLKEALISVDPGFISGQSDAVAVFNAAIADAETVYNTSATSQEYQAATGALETAMENFRNAPVNPLSVSTEEEVTWYYIVSASTRDYCRDKVIVPASPEAGSALKFEDQRMDPAMLWKITDLGNGKYGLANRASELFAGTTGGAYQPVTTTADPLPYTIQYLGEKGQFVIYEAGKDPLHCQESGAIIVHWPGGIDSPSAWHFRTVQNDAQQIDITSIEALQGPVATGKGNQDFVGLLFAVTAEGFTGTPRLEHMKFDLEGTSNIYDLDNLRLFSLGSDLRFRPGEHPLVGAVEITADTITLVPSNEFRIQPGKQHFAVVMDVNENAGEGNLVQTRILSAKVSGAATHVVTDPAPKFPATIFLSQSTLFSPGDLGSKFYRIPAIVTADDGSLVTATDRRNNHEGDLPADIDTYIRRSTDKGTTWSDPLMIAGENTTLGYGDPALVVERESGKIFCMMAHKQGFWGSTPTDPIRVTVSESADNGVSWTTPLDITDELYGAACTNPVSRNWNAIFVSSGRGIQLSSGRLMFAVAVRGTSGTIDNYVIYSDDKGMNWKVNSNQVHQGGDEAKLAQRNNGDVVISIRNYGNREWNVSGDNGFTWGTTTIHPDLVDPNCNGEIMTYTSTNDGFEKNRMLHSLAYATDRSNVSMLLSYDEGETFPIVKTICPTPSAYSTFTILPDRTIGMYYEDRSVGGGYDLVYVRFSLAWLTDGLDALDHSTAATRATPAKEKERFAWSRDQKLLVDSRYAEDWSVYTLGGLRVDPDARLQPGVYIVVAGQRSQKVVVL
ncbi:MAG: exo-alpha-sialidase [Bacteroidales bacterium]|nr:exo-alpha-sialidase [Bacteroidales bacterium]MDT8432113.1 exo-alpha-sialidase [Bacteroidales bacterium]